MQNCETDNRVDGANDSNAIYVQIYYHFCIGGHVDVIGTVGMGGQIATCQPGQESSDSPSTITLTGAQGTQRVILEAQSGADFVETDRGMRSSVRRMLK